MEPLLEANKCLDEANKLMKINLLKWTPDHDEAGQQFAKAASIFKQAKLHAEAIEANELAIKCYLSSQSSALKAAKCMEQAALSAKEIGDMHSVSKYYMKSIDMNTSSPMLQYQALCLWYSLCEESDYSSLNELINYCITHQPPFKLPLIICLVIRIVVNYLNTTKTRDHHDDENNNRKIYLQFIKSQLESSNRMVEFEAASAMVNLDTDISPECSDHKSAIAHLRNFLTSDKQALRFASVRLLNKLSATNSQEAFRFWSVHRIGRVCRLHLLNKRYRIGDHIIGLLDFTNTNLTCAKYTVILQCEETQQYELKQEFALGLKKSDIMLTIPNLLVNNTNNKEQQQSSSSPILHCVLSFLFYIVDENYSKTLFEDRAGTIELGPQELDTKLFSCDFPIAIHSTTHDNNNNDN